MISEKKLYSLLIIGIIILTIFLILKTHESKTNETNTAKYSQFVNKQMEEYANDLFKEFYNC